MRSWPITLICGKRPRVRPRQTWWVPCAVLMPSMPRRWLFLPINPGKVQTIAFMLLFHRSTSPMVFDAYVSAAKGDPSGLALMTMAYDMMMPKAMTWGEFFALGYSSDYEPGRNYMAELNQPEAVLGAPMSTAGLGRRQ